MFFLKFFIYINDDIIVIDFFFIYEVLWWDWRFLIYGYFSVIICYGGDIFFLLYLGSV